MSEVPPQTAHFAEAIASRAAHYLDLRRQALVRVTRRHEEAWDYVVWQQLANIRAQLQLQKAIGGIKYWVSDILMGDDEKRIREVLSTTNPQNSIFQQVVEQKEDDKIAARGAMEIKDNRTLYHHIDTKVGELLVLIQTFLWWDLEDASDQVRFEHKVTRLAALEQHGATAEQIAACATAMRREGNPPTADEVVFWELRQLRRIHDSFLSRRAEERNFKLIIAREDSPGESAEPVIAALGGQIQLLQLIRAGQPPPPEIRARFAQAVGCTEAELTAEREIAYLEHSISDMKTRLKNLLVAGGTGRSYDYKQAEAESLKARYEQVRRGREVPAWEAPALKAGMSSDAVPRPG